MVMNKDVTGVTNLTTQQSKDIWTGKITNWKDVGGPDQAIVLILRPASSGTRATFKKIVLGGADEATGQGAHRGLERRRHAGRRPDARRHQRHRPRLLRAEQGQADRHSSWTASTRASTPSKSGPYKLQAFGHMYTKGEATGLTKAFIDYMSAPEAQAIAASPLLRTGQVRRPA